MVDIDKVIELSERKVKLLKEYKESLNEESADYIVCNAGLQSSGVGYHSQSTYVIVDRKTNTNMDAGPKSRIEKYIEKKRLSNVYWRK